MKKTIIVLSIFFSINALAYEPEPRGETSYEGIKFEEGNWKNVLATAEKKEKIIFLDLYASWCGPCKMLKSRTFPDSQVGQFFNTNFVNYKLDAEKGEGISLASKYAVTAYPTLIFLDSKGNVLARTVGFHNARELIEVGKQIIDN